MMELPPNNEELNKTEDKSGTIEIIGECPEGNEIINKSTRFTAHNMSYKFPILSGIQPKSTHSFNMKNWTGYKFINDDYMVVSTPKSILIDVNQTLGAGSIGDLNLKYTEIAQAHANNFAKQHDLTLGTPQRHRKPHFTFVK